MRTKRLTILTMVAWGFVLVISAIIFVSLFIGRGMGRNFLFGVGYTQNNRSNFVVVKEEEFYYMNSLNLEWIDGNVTFFPSDGYAIRVVQKAHKDIDKSHFFTTTKFEAIKNEFHEDNTLTIRDGRNNNRNFRLFSLPKRNYATDIEIYLPQNIYKNINIECVSSDVDFTDVNSTNLKVETVSGNVYGSASTNNLQFNTVSGNFKLSLGNPKVGNVEIDTESVSGNVELKLDSMPTDIRTNSISGDVKLILPENNFTANLDTVSGDMKLDNISNSKGNKHYITAGDGECGIDAETVSGDLSISVR